MRASATPFVFRASATSFSPTFVQSTPSCGSTTKTISAVPPPPLPVPVEAAACGNATIDTPALGLTGVPAKITLSFEKAAALFAAGAAKTKMLYGNPVLTLAQKIQLKQLQVLIKLAILQASTLTHTLLFVQDRFATLPAVVVENAWRAYSYNSLAAESALLEAFGEPEKGIVDGTMEIMVLLSIYTCVF